MRFILLTAGVTLVVFLGLMIDAQSRTPVDRAVAPSASSTICAPGRVEGATPEIELRPQLAGRIVALLVEEGQFVQKDQVLLQLDDEQYRHEVALAAARLALAEAQLERLQNGARQEERAEAAALYQAKVAELKGAELSWNRILQLREGRAVSQQDADNQRTLVAALRAEVEAAKARLQLIQADARRDEVLMQKARIQTAQAQLELAKVQLERTKLRAATCGRILKLNVEAGELAGPTSTEPAVVMADTRRFQVRAFVEELDAPRVKPGMTATIVADGMPDRELKGRVVRLSPRMGRKQLFSDDPTEHHDTKTRELWLELLPDAHDGELGFQGEKSAELVVGLRVDVIIDPQSPAPPAAEPVDSEGSTPDSSPPLELEPLAQIGSVQP